MRNWCGGGGGTHRHIISIPTQQQFNRSYKVDFNEQ